MFVKGNDLLQVGGMMCKRAFVALFTFTLVAFTAYAQDKSVRPEWISGFVVAYDEIDATTPCTRSCERFVIVRLDSEKDNEDARYVRVGVKLKEDEAFPRQLVIKKQRWRFKVIRTPMLDEPVYEYIVQNASEVAPERKLFIWKLIPGAEGEKLPFNEKIASYLITRSAFKSVTN